MLAGCYQSAPPVEALSRCDYRERHPITLQEGERTVEIFLGRNRGGLTAGAARRRARLRAAVAARGHRRHRHRRAQGGPTDRAAADSLREIHSILVASGVPQGAVYVRRYPAAAIPRWRASSINYSKLTAQAGPCGLWPDDLGPADRPQLHRKPPVLEFRLRHPAQSRRHGRQPADLVQPRGEQPAYEPRRSVVLDKYRKGESTGGAYTRLRHGQDQRRRKMIKHALTTRSRRRPGHAGGARRRRRRAYRAGAARFGPGLLRDGGDRRRRAGGRRGPPPGQGACQDPDGRRRRRGRGLSQFADAERHPASNRTTAPTRSSPASTSSPRSATPAPGSS